MLELISLGNSVVEVVHTLNGGGGISELSEMNTELEMSTEREANVLNSHNTSQGEKHRKRGHVVVRQVASN